MARMERKRARRAARERADAQEAEEAAESARDAAEIATLQAGGAGVRPLPIVKVVGVSASGKSTLSRRLRAAGYDARPVSQEHSSVPTLWKEFGMPKALIYLDVSLKAQQARRPNVTWHEEHRTQEVERLADAREHADLVIDTSTQASEAVLAIALAFLGGKDVRKAARALPPLGETGAPGRQT